MATVHYNYIREEIELDFPIPDLIKATMKEAEELDLQNNLEYFCVADAIDVLCKNYVGAGKLTERQWDLISWKYPINGKD